ncbi:PQQ-dependent sugar dehydrogenase [Pontibacter sp. Tf4]|uniref:PQQ-dependent sugar dehydrogenase n=1 Tax=Pontibacter sp. Tf4 TaxID=2761620 RepID=UPI001626FC5E|nr:PQQ-dependent sugar dehydrogenase [Pontibacter sp. Tf4]MBB6613028.1 PQQ-dependent sugar dehydrogenase [Pontibacter sp. Tf4]
MKKQRSQILVSILFTGLLLTVSSCQDDPVLEEYEATETEEAIDNGFSPTLVDNKLKVNPVISELITPISMAFIGDDDFFILEKNTGQVKRIKDGSVHSTVLDLAVNFGSERGLLGIALHPNFPDNPGVYLYWTESTTGADTDVLSETPLLGNRVDRFTWNGTTLTQDANIIQLRAIQQDAGQPERGNHDGGVLRFGPDGKLYIFIGDVGRRGQLQNLEDGPFGPGIPDDQFGGPEPDDAHLTGVVLRLNENGTTPGDNPFFEAGADIGGEVGENIQKIFSYGHRNSFGMAFDPIAGNLWLQENGDDAFSELNRVIPGMNGGWIQIMGPVSRISQFKEIETSAQYFGLQQIRWSPENIADSPEEALSRLFMIPGAQYVDPEFSWKFEVSPGGIGFIDSKALGSHYRGDLIMGGARDFLEGGHLFHFNLIGNRTKVGVRDPRLQDRVADNPDKWTINESESLLFGTNFGVTTDIQTGPDGNLYVVSLSHGSVYEISSRGK